MKATKIVFPGSYKVSFQMEEIAPEGLGEEEVLIENHYSLISPGTELAIYTGSHVGFADPDNTWVKYPFRPGYASSGIVTHAGKNVQGFEVGDAVLTSGYHCSHQIFDLSEPNPPAGEEVLKLPQAIDLKDAPFVKIAMIPTIVFEVGEFKIGDCVVVFGLGLIGNFATQLLRLHGLRVIGIDPIEMRRKVALDCGLAWAMDSEAEDFSQHLASVCGERGVAAVIEATGNPKLVTPALKCLRPRGQVILLGSPRGKADIDVYNDIHVSGARLIGAHVGVYRFSLYRGNQPAFEYAMDMVEAGFLQARRLVTHTLQPEDIQEGYRMLIEEKNKALGVILAWPAAAKG